MRWLKLPETLKHFGQIREGEGITALLMINYSFLVMTSYSIIKPITRSKFIDGLGAENIPYIQLAAGVMIGGIMLGYSWLMARLPRRWGLPIIQGWIAILLLLFWFLFHLDSEWISVAFYFTGLIIGLLLISQFWTVANIIYDVRQAKRLFGFIGAGAPLGGIVGSLITVLWVGRIGSTNLLLVSTIFMSLGIVVVIAIILREPSGNQSPIFREGRAPNPWQAMDLLRNSKQLQFIALVMCLAAICDTIIEQQLNMAAEALKGEESAIAGFLAGLQILTSSFSVLIQFLLTSRILRLLGIGFAIMILPISTGLTAAIILLNAALWAPATARVVDQSLRYTVEKTTREMLYMPLPGDIKIRAKTFVDVTVDRFSKGLAAILILFLIKPWGLNLNLQQISYATLVIMVLWILTALRAKRDYIDSFHRSLETRAVMPSDVAIADADISTLKGLVEELDLDDEQRVMYAMDILESLDKKELITPLVLEHDSRAVQIRALRLLNNLSPPMALQWLPRVKLLLNGKDSELRAAAIGALAGMTSIDTTKMVRPCLSDENPSIALTAAMILTRSHNPDDWKAAEGVLEKFGTDPASWSVETRKELAAVLGRIPDARFYRLLLPLLADSSLDVAQEAMRSVRLVGASDFIFVPALVLLLRNPWLKSGAREMLAEYGPEVLNTLDHYLGEREEDIFIRRQIPSTIARIPCWESAAILLDALDYPDGQIHFEVLAGLERLHERNGLDFDSVLIEQQILKEGERQTYYAAFCQRFREEGMPGGSSLLAAALREKTDRGIDRIFRLLGLILPLRDIAAARWSIESGRPSRAKALEYLDNMLSAGLRRRIIPVLEQFLAYQTPNKPSMAENMVLKRSLSRLIEDPDPVISAAAIHWIGNLKLQQYGGLLKDLSASPKSSDQYVSETVSWALWRLQQTEEADTTLWPYALPIVEIVWKLNRLPLFASTSIDGLFRIASSGRQVRYGSGETICNAGSKNDEFIFLIEGKVVHQNRLASEKEIVAPIPVNFEEVLTGAVMREPVKAAGSCICYCLTSKELSLLLSQNPGLIEGFLRFLCSFSSSEIANPVVRGKCSSLSSDEGKLKLTDKILLLKSFPVFSSLSHEELMFVVAIASELRLAEGTELFGEMAKPALHAIVSGLVMIETPDEEIPVSASVGDAIGLYQMLSGVPLARRAVCAANSLILRVERDDFLDLLLKRPELMHRLLASLYSFGG